MRHNLRVFVIGLAAMILSLRSFSQIFQGPGTFKGAIASIDMCDGKAPVSHDKNLNLKGKTSDSCNGAAGARCKVSFDGEQTEWRGPDTAIRTLDLSCYYTNADYGTDNNACGSKTQFSTIGYTTLVIFPQFTKPLWNVTIDISYSGENFLNENVFVRVEVADDSDDSKSITSLIMPCDDENAFSGDSPGEIIDMPPGKYVLRISQPDYAALNDKTTKHKEGKLYIKYKVMVTGHD